MILPVISVNFAFFTHCFYFLILCFNMQQEGFMWVLLDGGPSRAFSDSDTVLIEEDFNMLKVIPIPLPSEDYFIVMIYSNI